VEALEAKGAGCYSEPILPQEFMSKSHEGRTAILRDCELDMVVTSIFFRSDNCCTDQDVQIACSLPGLKTLRLSGQGITAGCLSKLQAAESLVELALYGPQFDDDILQYLLPLTGIRELMFQECSLSDETVDCIRATRIPGECAISIF
tara:strand:- start:380 stop:823 length:444 start_codon:yes stop_codon:yes gene_type:complete